MTIFKSDDDTVLFAPVTDAANKYIESQSSTEKNLFLEDFCEGLNKSEVEEVVLKILEAYKLRVPLHGGHITDAIVNAAYAQAFLQWKKEGMKIPYAFLGSPDHRGEPINQQKVLEILLGKKIEVLGQHENSLLNEMKKFSKESNLFMDKILDF